MLCCARQILMDNGLHPTFANFRCIKLTRFERLALSCSTKACFPGHFGKLNGYLMGRNKCNLCQNTNGRALRIITVLRLWPLWFGSIISDQATINTHVLDWSLTKKVLFSLKLQHDNHPCAWASLWKMFPRIYPISCVSCCSTSRCAIEAVLPHNKQESAKETDANRTGSFCL